MPPTPAEPATGSGRSFVAKSVAALCLALLIGLIPYSARLKAEDGEWITVTDPSLEIVAGSPLDFSAITPRLPEERMTINGERLTFGGAPMPINCALLGPGFSNTPGSGFPDHDTARRYAVQLRRHGYNLVRFHFNDALLMRGAREDFAFNPELLDRFHFFMAELRRQNIHWLVDILASDNGGLGNIFPHRWSTNRGMVVGSMLDPAAMRHWQGLAQALLTARNPYTGQTIASDPHTAGLILVNEPNLDFRMEVANHFDPGPIPPVFLNAYRAAGGVDPPASSTEDGPRMERLQRFFVTRQNDAWRTMSATVARLGYDGSASSFEAWKQYNQIPTLRVLPMVAMHAYQADQVASGNEIGRLLRQASSVVDQGRHLQLVASMRLFGKPLVLTEHDQIFWNANRFESGLVTPAYGALQGWQFLCRHADGPIDLAYDGQGLRKEAIEPDGVGLDPAARAAETLTALLWLRREIAPAPGAVRLRISDDEALRDGGRRRLPRDLGALGWIARLGIADQSASPPGPGIDASLAPDPVNDALRSDQSRRARSMVAALRSAGALPADNATDPATGRWDAPGGQVSLRTVERQLRVTTRLTSALAGPAIETPVTIGPVRLVRSDAPALVAFSALDGAPIGTSRRMLVILAGDARNSGMQVDSMGRLLALGKLPVQIRRVRLQAELPSPAAGAWRLTPLALTGTALAGQRIAAVGGRVTVDLDTGAPGGPTTYFLLERL